MNTLKKEILYQENYGKLLDKEIIVEQTKQIQYVEQTKQALEKTKQLKLELKILKFKIQNNCI